MQEISSAAAAWQMLSGHLDLDRPFGHEGAIEGDIVRFRVGHRLFFSVTNPEYVEHILFKHPDRYAKSLEYELLRSVVGLSLFTDEGDSWRHHRQMLNPLMARRHLNGMVDLMVDPIEAYVARLAAAGDRHELDMAVDMTELTLEVVGSALFGRGLGELARRLGPAVTTGLRAAEVAARLLVLVGPPAWAIRASAGFVHRSPLMPPPLRGIQRTMRTVDEVVWDIIDDRRANPQPDADDLVGLLLGIREPDGSAWPLKRVRDELVTFMLAGHETTANGMAWMWYLLALNPAARERMIDEVDAVLGDRRPTAADVPALPWTMACFQEALRYYSPAWVLPRKVVADDVIGGHRIPRGSTVFIPTHTIHHDPRWWPDPETFDPERFMGENGRGRHRAAYLPFGGGRRICIGMAFALMEGTLMTAMMSRHARFELVPGHPVEPETTLTVRPRHGLRMIVRERAGAAAGGTEVAA
jgi:cytochrome P450